jgi:hypothetical protein
MPATPQFAAADHRARISFALRFTVLAAVLAPSLLTAQIIFQRAYGGAANDYGYSVLQAADSGYVIVGHTYSFGAGNADAYLVKTDAAGNELWHRTFGGSDDDYGWSIRPTPDGGFIIAGITYSFGHPDGDVYLIKTDSAGEEQWSRTYGGSGSDHGYCAAPTPDGGFIVTGTHGTTPDNSDVYLIKTDSLGNRQWERTYGGDSADYGWEVQPIADGGYVIAGSTNSFGAGGWDGYVLRIDPDGDTLWTMTCGGTAFDALYSVQPTAGSGCLAAGETESFGAGDRDVFVIRTDAAGDTVWTRTFGGAAREEGSSIRPTSDGSYVVVGSTASYGTGDVDVYLVKLGGNGDSAWTRAFGGPDWEIGKAVEQTTDGGFVVAGSTESFGAGLIDMYLIKTDSLGWSTAVAEPGPARTTTLALSCEPNPFSSSAVLRLTAGPAARSVAIRIYDAQGRAVRRLSCAISSRASLAWDGTDEFGRALAPGAYFVRCQVAGEETTVRVTIQR